MIVTNKRDLTSDFIVRELSQRGHNFFRLNTEDVTELSIIQGQVGAATQLISAGTTIALSGVLAAYFRRPLPPRTISADTPASIANYVREEWTYLLRSLYLELDKRWFNHPNSIALAEDKPKQLRLAQDVGFSVPETIITNMVEPLHDLFESGEVVAKPLKQSLLEEANRPDRVIYTNTIDSRDQIDPDELGLAPVIFQRKIPKQYDLRVTVVEQNVFAVAIDSQRFSATETDWRHSSVVELPHDVVNLPPQTVQQCITLVQRLGLNYGAIDLVLGKDGTYWFLECNPNGQWAWIENRTGLRISAAIVDSMERISQ
ncbi:MAG: hypothetical protein NXH91_06505 [Phyllobacteriaceae bacterium]|nr:hypothetical protein [Phyllobacteriaceae bacterium]